MKNFGRILPLVGIFWSSLYAYEYIYPVGTYFDYDGEQQVLSLYQKTPDHTELWQRNITTGEINRALLSTFTPVGIAMLPNNSGFSFFDNGRLRIHHFLKRSPKAIDIYEPIYDIGPLQWVSSDECIFHAKERDQFSLYTLSAFDGSVTKIVSQETSDCFYPSQVGEALFFIQHKKVQKNFFKEEEPFSTDREAEGTGTESSLVKRVLDKYSQEEGLTTKSTTGTCSEDEIKSGGDYTIFCQLSGREYCLVSHTKPLAFLSMINNHEGIVIEHQGDIDRKKDTVLSCICYKLTCSYLGESGTDLCITGTLSKLFTFSLPLTLLLPSSKARLCESIYPLLPRICGEIIYFVSTVDQTLMTQPFRFTKEAGVQPLCFSGKTLEPFTDIFTPYPVEARLVYGGSLQPELLREDQEPAEALILT